MLVSGYLLQPKGKAQHVLSDMMQLKLESLSRWTWAQVSSIDISVPWCKWDGFSPSASKHHSAAWWSRSCPCHHHEHQKCVLMLIGKARKSKTSMCIPLIFQVVEVCSQSNFTSFEYACIVMVSAHRSLVRSKCTGNGAAKGSAYCWWGRGMEEEKDSLEGHLCCHWCWKCCSWRLAWQWSVSKDACVLGALASHCKVAVVTQALTVEVWSAWVSLV